MSVPAFNTYTHPSANNVYIPNYDESLRLLVSYVRDPKAFRINDYVTFSTIDKPEGYFMKFYAGDNVRVSVDDLKDGAWPDGQRRPISTSGWNTGRFTNDRYFAQRYSFNVTIGKVAIDNAAYDIAAYERNNLASKIMTAKAKFIIDTMTDPVEYPFLNVSTATLLGGGFFSAGTINNPIIKTALYKVRDRIIKATNAKVSVQNLCLVMNPTTAGAIASAQELFAYQAQQANSLQVLSGQNPSILNAWGLPENLHGFKVIVDDSVVVNAKTRDVQDTVEYLFPDNVIAVVASPGSIDPMAGGTGFSTIHCLEVKGKQMQVWEKMDDYHELLDISVSDYFTPFVVAPESGFLIRNVLS